MIRPDFISEKDIERWSEVIDQDPNMTFFKFSPTVREVCYAGCYLYEELKKLQCPDILIARIQWTAGKLSFGKNPWEVHQKIIEQYKNNKLVFENEPPEN